MAIVNISVSSAIPPNPASKRVLRPALSTKTRETTVIRTLIAPKPIVAYVELSPDKPDSLKISVEKKMT